MSLPVIFLKFKVDVVAVERIESRLGLVYPIQTLDDVAVLAVNTMIPGGHIGDGVSITNDYDYITSQLQYPIFAGGISLINTHSLSGWYDVDAYTAILKRYAPGAIVYTVDYESDSGDSGWIPGTSYLYGLMLTELSTGDYGLFSSTKSGSSWYNKNGAYLTDISNYNPFAIVEFRTTESPNLVSAVTLVPGINDDKSIVAGSGSIAGARLHATSLTTSISSVSRAGQGDLVALINRWEHYMTPPGGSDPYDQIPNSGTGGGGGTYDPSSSDDIDFPGIPGVSAVNTGFISLWSPTEQQMLNLSRYMWNVDITTIDFWKRLWADPMDIIYGLNIIPVDFRATGRTIIGGTEHVIVGLVNTKVDMDYLVSQWIDVDCGSIDIDEMWGAYLDYDPYTKLEIYLPYCGYHPLRIDDFMSGSISLKYRIDLLSGACIAIIKATKPNDEVNDLDSVIYQFMGNCATQIPVTATQFADAVRSTMSLAASIGTMVATGVGGAAAAASKQGLSTVGKAQLASSVIGEGAAAVENVMGIKPAIERSGALGGAAGLLSVQTPYLILTRPRQAHPEAQNVYTGYPSFMTRELSQCTGWTIVKEIHLDNIPCTSDEMIEIDNLLKEGVIL